MGRASLGLIVLLGAVVASLAQDWPRWRGPEGNAVSTEAPLPTTWDKNRGIRWKTAIPGEGASSPIVWRDRVFVTSALEHGTRRVVHCLDRGSGTSRWTGEIADKNPERTSALTGHAAATPVTDGERVVAFFGNAGVVCFDLQGRQLWHRNLGEFDSELGLASSPVIHDRRVYLVCDHDGDRFTSFDSYLIALDAVTGATVWKIERRGLLRSWSTPIVVNDHADKPQLLVAAQDHLRAYNPDTGRQLWQAAGLTGWVAPSPVTGLGIIFATSGKNGALLALRPDGAEVWRKENVGPYVCSPLLHGDHLYVHNEQGILTCYAAKSGEMVYRERLEGKFTASGAAGDGKLYLTNEEGTTFVVKLGPRYELLARNRLEEYTLASPAISKGCLFLRTEKHLWCVEGGGQR
jgi:outer membrane protein assembly factor BamB